MSEEISNYGKLLEIAGSLIKKQNVGPLLLCIDGGEGVGKSYIAESLWKDLGGGIIHGDNFKTGSLNGKHEFLVKELRQEINNFMRMHSFIVIFESVLLWQVLDRLGVNPDLVVYIKRLSGNNSVSWVDEDELGNFNPFRGASSFRKQVIAYHKSQNPTKNADVIYHISWTGS